MSPFLCKLYLYRDIHCQSMANICGVNALRDKRKKTSPTVKAGETFRGREIPRAGRKKNLKKGEEM